MGKAVIGAAFKPVYADILARGHGEYMLAGGRGSLKSSFISIVIVLGLMQDSAACAIAYRRVFNTVKDSVYEQIIWAIDMLGLTDEFRARKNPLEIERTSTGQRILFRGMDDPAKSKSIKLKRGQYFKYLWFEELAELRGMEDVRSVKQSIFRGVDDAFTFFSYNPPKSAQSWVNRESLKAVDGRMVHRSTYLQAPPEWLGEKFLAEARSLEKSNERAYRNEYLGEITGSGGQVFDNLKLRAVPDEELRELEYFFQGIDWGYFPDPFHWVRCGYDAKRRRLYIFDELRLYRTGNHAAFDALRGRLRPDEPLSADSAEKKSIADFKELGAAWIRPSVKGPGSVDYSMKWLAALNEIIIDPARCPETAAEFAGYEYEINKNGEYVSGYVDAANHGIDAVRYALCPVWKTKGR